MRTRTIQRVKRGFTLIEILIVVVILGILAAIVIPQFAESSEAAQANAAQSTLQTVRAQFELCKFRGDCNCSMNWGQIETALTSVPTGGESPYLASAPTLPEGYSFDSSLTNCNITMSTPGDSSD
ncbi:MAG: prepilin-type N-terminal cleavage/methylation domain-containing protein [Phycisphaerales bacterium]|nr:MAG: prepilin-type N-terminal cleavage/methylation domain-containing protein [Phycisphaerales bacterium]